MSNAVQPDTLPVVNGFLLVLNTLVALAVYFGPKLFDAGTADDNQTTSGGSGAPSAFASGIGDLSQYTPNDQPRQPMQSIREDDEGDSTSSDTPHDSDDKESQRRSASRVGFDGRIHSHGLGDP